MMKHFNRSTAITVLVLAMLVTTASAQSTSFEGNITTRPAASGDLLSQMRSAAEAAVSAGSDIAWVGYLLPVRKQFSVAVSTSFLSGRSFNGTIHGGIAMPDGAEGIEVTGGDTKAILHLYRKGNPKGAPEQILIAPGDDRLTFNAPLVLFTGVTAEQSNAAHITIAEDSGSKVRDEAFAILAMSRGEEGMRWLENFVTSQADEDDREDALQWYAYGMEGNEYERIARMDSRIHGEEVREELTFVYFRIGTEPALRRLLDMSRTESEEVREQAVFWLGQAAFKQQYGDSDADIGELSEEDRQSIFVLSRMESRKSREALERLVRKGKNRAVRKAALFWLTRDPDEQTVDLIEELLFARR